MIGNPVLNQSGSVNGLAYFQKFIPAAIDLALVVGVLFFFVILGAIQWISSGGDKQALEGARSKITSAIIGIVIMFALFAVVSLISYFFGGLSLINPTISPLTQ